MVDQSYVERCLTAKFQDQSETRNWQSDQQLVSVISLLREGNYILGAKEAELVVSKFPDLDLVYQWWSSALRELGDYTQAREVALKGLEASRRKNILCNTLGEIEWKSKNPKEAIYWWVQGLLSTQALDLSDRNAQTHLYLHYIAKGLGEEKTANAFIAMADKIRFPPQRLDTTEANQLQASVNRLTVEEAAQVEGVLDYCRKKYLAP